MIGNHISHSGHPEETPLLSRKIGSETFQFFTRNPYTYKNPPIPENIINKFRTNLKKTGIKDFYVHAPYIVNIASPENRIFYASVKLIADELIRASTFGAKYVMFHTGSAKEGTKKEGIERAIEGIEKVLEQYKKASGGKTNLLVENNAGSGNCIGSTLEELREMFKPFKKNPIVSGICLDTCHIFVSGYDLSTEKTVDDFVKQFDKIIGLQYLKLIHLNDSKKDLGTKVDRHEDLGKGYIGKLGIAAILNHPKLRKLDFIIETPGNHNKDVAFAKSLLTTQLS